MKIVGVVAAKENSKRFPGKNAYEVDGEPLFWHSVQPMLSSGKVHEVIVSTDSKFIAEFCRKRGVVVIERGINSNHTDEPLIDVIKYTIKSYHGNYDALITIMANCPNHTSGDVDAAIDLLEKNDELNEVRGFDKSGLETGLILLRKRVIEGQYQISSHIAMVETDGYEIHYKNDIR